MIILIKLKKGCTSSMSQMVADDSQKVSQRDNADDNDQDQGHTNDVISQIQSPVKVAANGIRLMLSGLTIHLQPENWKNGRREIRINGVEL